MLFILFGLPGAGKTYVGHILEKYYNFYFYDGDTAIPKKMQHALSAQDIITNDMRDDFFASLLRSIKTLTAKHTNIVVSQTFIKEKYRLLFLSNFKEAQFILVETDTSIREKRLLKRKKYILPIAYARKMEQIFDCPKIAYTTINNNASGKSCIEKQLHLLVTKNLR